MNTFSLVTRSLAATENDPDKADLDQQTREMGRVLTAVQTVVDTLTPAGAGRFVVGFANISTAGTSLAALRITVSAKPLYDPSLSLAEKAVVIATFAAHEIGHTYVTAPRKALVQAHSQKPGYHAVANISDDIVLEPFMVDKFPILADAFEFTGHWVLRTTAEVLPKVERIYFGMPTVERFNLLISATRYGDIPEIVWADAATLVERDWCRDWAKRLLALPVKDHTGYLRLTDEVWEHLRTEEQPEPEPEPGEGEPEPGGEPEPDEDGGDEGEPLGPGPTPGPFDDDEDEDEPSDDGEPSPDGDGEDGESDEDGDDDGDSDEDGGDDTDGGSEDGDDSDGEDDDEDGGDTGSGDSESEDDDATDGDGDDDEDGDSDDESDESDTTSRSKDRDGGGGNPDATIRDEDDFNVDDLDDTTHDQSEADDSDEADRAEEKVRIFESTTATSFGRHGHYSTIWE